MILVSTEIAAYLQTQGLGTLGTNLYKERMPEMPDTATAIFSTGGIMSDPKEGYDNPTIEVMTRADDPATAYNQIAAIYNVLQGLNNVLLASGTRLVHMWALQSQPINIGQDENKRTRFTQNYQLLVRNVTTHRV